MEKPELIEYMTVAQIVKDYLIGDKQAPVHFCWCNNDRNEEDRVNRLGMPPIKCWSRNGTLLGTYDTLEQAQEATGVNYSQVSMNLKGKVKYCKKGTIYFTRDTY